MGKKTRNKQKMSGSEKTQIKTQKKLDNKHKKELAAIGEDDIEQIMIEIEREEAKRQSIVETILKAPSRRSSFSLSVHPFKDELILFGGEFHNGKQTITYGDLLFYNLSKKQWTMIKAPGAPPPRSGHQTVTTAVEKGELWVFGGEFCSSSESQFYHYKDLWRYQLGEKKWEKIVATGGPSPRSGHRMVHMKKKLIIFGGFYDNLRSYKYFNDVHIFDLTTYKWNNLVISGSSPSPRSGCIIFPTPQNTILVYGGYSKEHLKKGEEKGHIHTDMFILSPLKDDITGLKWKWSMTKQTGEVIAPRCSASGILVQTGLGYIFGGVFDDYDDNEMTNPILFNDLLTLDLEKFQWRSVKLSGNDEAIAKRGRKRNEENHIKTDDNHSRSDDDSVNDNHKDTDSPSETFTTQTPTVITNDDDVFTMTISAAPGNSGANTCKDVSVKNESCLPRPRLNPGLAIKNGVLYLYGGQFEDGDKVYALNDMYTLDTKKLDVWKTVMHDEIHPKMSKDPKNLEFQYSDSDDCDSDDSDIETDSCGSNNEDTDDEK